MLDAKDKVANATITAANYRGAFPIWAWVGKWDPYVVTDEKGNIVNPNALPTDMNGYLNVEPSFAGREVTMYSEPSWISTTVASPKDVSPSAVNNSLSVEVGSLAGRSNTKYYIPITLAVGWVR